MCWRRELRRRSRRAACALRVVARDVTTSAGFAPATSSAATSASSTAWPLAERRERISAGARGEQDRAARGGGGHAKQYAFRRLPRTITRWSARCRHPEARHADAPVVLDRRRRLRRARSRRARSGSTRGRCAAADASPRVLERRLGRALRQKRPTGRTCLDACDAPQRQRGASSSATHSSRDRVSVRSATAASVFIRR